MGRRAGLMLWCCLKDKIEDKAVEEADAPFCMQATKLANVLFTYELQRRLGQHGIQVACCMTVNCPGCRRQWHGSWLQCTGALATVCRLSYVSV